MQGAPDTALVAQKVIDAVSRPYEIEGRTVTVTASIGASLFPAHGVDVDELIAAADAALYEAKRAGKNTCRIAQK